MRISGRGSHCRRTARRLVRRTEQEEGGLHQSLRLRAAGASSLARQIGVGAIAVNPVGVRLAAPAESMNDWRGGRGMMIRKLCAG
jgi:hypothetical protein